LERLQLLTGFKPHSLSRWNGNLRAGARIAPDTGLPRFYIKDAKAAQLDAVALLKSLLHRLENGFDCHLGFGFGDAGAVYNFIDDIELDQLGPLLRGTGYTLPASVNLMIGLLLSLCQAQVGMHRVTSEEFRRACGRFATGVTIATVFDKEGIPHGLTVSSFTSVSLHPPLILICLGHAVTVIEAFRAAQYFGINVLSDSQQKLSEKFARKGHDRFGGVEWERGESGVPLLPDVIAAIECKIQQRFTSGDHDIFVGEMVRGRVAEGEPLIYFASHYRQLADS
jgi:flavin reductase (DIM6/NTAB) family NADH-FMN oxidoreductase RutF